MDPFIALIKSLAEMLKDPMVRKLLAACAATWLISMLATNAITAMKRPTESSSEAYRYWFTFLNGCVGSWKRIEKFAHVPGVEDDPAAK